MWRLALAIGIGTFAQGPLGGITVLTDLHPIAVMSHFLLALVVLAIAIVLLVDRRGWAAPWAPRPRWTLPAAIVLPVATFALVVSGAVVTMSGHASRRRRRQRLWNLLDAAYVHVRIAVTSWRSWRRSCYGAGPHRAPAAGHGAAGLGAGAVVALQIGIGEYQWRHQLPWWAVLGARLGGGAPVERLDRPGSLAAPAGRAGAPGGPGAAAPAGAQAEPAPAAGARPVS